MLWFKKEPCMKYIKENDPVYGNVYRFLGEGEEVAAVDEANAIVKEYGLTAEMLPVEIMRRGVQGDEGTYTRVIMLKGTFLTDEKLSELSTKISNTIPVNTVVFETS